MIKCNQTCIVYMHGVFCFNIGFIFFYFLFFVFLIPQYVHSAHICNFLLKTFYYYNIYYFLFAIEQIASFFPMVAGCIQEMNRQKWKFNTKAQCVICFRFEWNRFNFFLFYFIFRFSFWILLSFGFFSFKMCWSILLRIYNLFLLQKRTFCFNFMGFVL